MGERGDLWAMARRQHGLFAKEQARRCLSVSELRRMVERGDVLNIRRGVFVLAGSVPSYEQAVLAAVLAAGGVAWASHRTAARLHGLDVPAPTGIDVLTLPVRRLRMAGVAHHRSQSVPRRDVGRVGVIPATGVARTLVDCAPWLPGRALSRAVDDARRRHLVEMGDIEAVHQALDNGRRTGRRLVVPLRPVVGDRHDAGGSERELDVLGILRKADVPLPVQQHPVLASGRRWFLDFAYPTERIYLEFDGFAEHGLIRSKFDSDRERDAELALAGWLPLHFTSNTRPEDVVSRVARALVARRAGAP